MRIVGAAFKEQKNAPTVTPIFLYSILFNVISNSFLRFTSFPGGVSFDGFFSRKRFTLNFAPRILSELDAIKEFYSQQSGQEQPFGFLNPLDSVTYVVRFEAGSFEITRQAFNLYQASAVLVEVF